MKTLAKPSLLLFILLAAVSDFGYSAPPPNVVASDSGGNTAMGSDALSLLTDGHFNTASGAVALHNNTSGSYNTASGYQALMGNVTGYDNVAFGTYALGLNSTGSENTATGYAALYSNLSGTNNTATGSQASASNTTGNNNSAFGYATLFSNSIGSFNAAFGINALNQNTTGSYNTALGSSVANYNSSGRRNVAVGYDALHDNSTGHGNTAIGTYAGQHTTGNDNVLVANRGLAGESQVMRLGVKGTAGVVGSGVTRTYIAGIKGVTTGLAGSQVLIDANGQLGTISSSRVVKKNIRPMGTASERLLALRPVTFQYKLADAAGGHPTQYGLIAEEVAEVFPELVVRDEQGQAETVAYHLLPSLLLNEVQKEHRLNQHLAEQLAQQQGQLAAQASQLAEIGELKRQLAALQELVARLQSRSKEERVAMK